MRGVYLLHFQMPYQHARHYLGWSSNIQYRVYTHRRGNSHSVPLMQAIAQAGIPFELARTWENGDKREERRLRNYKNNPKLCPICRQFNKELDANQRHATDDLPF